MQVSVPKSKDFVNQRGEKLSEGMWTFFESLVVHEISIVHKECDTSIITKIYNDIVSYSTAPYCVTSLPINIVFRNKTEMQVQRKIAHTEMQAYFVS